MTTSNLHLSAGGDLRKHRTPSHSPLQQKAKPNAKSASRSLHCSDSDVSDEDGFGDSNGEASSTSEDEEEDSSADEADVSALSGATALKREQRLAGQLMNDETMNDDDQAAAGAEEDDESSPDAEYAGVDGISGDEDSEADLQDGVLMRTAEQDLIEEFERNEHQRGATSVTTGMSDMFLQEGDALAVELDLQSNDGMADLPTLDDGVSRSVFGVDMNDDPFLGLSQTDGLYREMYDDAEQALGLWRLPDSEINQRHSPETGKKRVRFEDVEQTLSRSNSLSSAEDEDADEAFPDLFAAQDDPAVRQHFALDADPDATFQYDLDDTASFYDFDGEEERMALELDDEDSDDDDDDDMSSFDSEDDGDTTDEESAEEQIARMRKMKKATDKSPKLAPSTPRRPIPALDRASSLGRSATPQSSKSPALGTFTLDKSRASMSADASGKQIKVFPPVNPAGKDKAFWDRARMAARSRSSTPRSAAFWSMRTAAAENMPDRPFTAQSTLGSMFNGNLDILRNNDVSGIAAGMFPAMLPRADTTTTSTSMGDESDSEVHDINMQEFIDIDDSGSDSDDPQSTPIMSPGGHVDLFESFTSLGPSPRIRKNSGTGLLDHLDKNRGLVGSFRRNQNQVKHVSSLASNAAERASTSEYNALQKGRRAAANTPMTPARKKHPSQDLGLTGAGIRKAVSSPMAARRPRSRGGSGSGMHQTLGQAIMK